MIYQLIIIMDGNPDILRDSVYHACAKLIKMS